MNVLHVYMCTTGMSGDFGGQKTVSDSLELESWMIVNYIWMLLTTEAFLQPTSCWFYVKFKSILKSRKPTHVRIRNKDKSREGDPKQSHLSGVGEC